MIKLAVSKGYLLKKSLSLLEKIGYTFHLDDLDSRKLQIEDKTKSLRLLLVRPSDVPVYVEHGSVDLGIVGKDVLLEKEADVCELLDLKFGTCKLVLAGLSAMTPEKLTHHMSVATKFPNCCQKYFHKKGLNVQIIKLYGSIELAPITGLSEIICDLTATGQTLAENNLNIIDEIFSSTARLVANPVNLKFNYNKLLNIYNKLKAEIE